MTSFSEATLRDYLAVMRRRWWIIASLVVVGIVAGLLLAAVQTPLYQSSARVLVQQRTSSALFDPQTGQALKTDISTEIELQLLTSQRVREVVEERLGAPAGVRATVGGQGTVLVVRAIDPDPDRAALEANAFAQAYLDVRRELQVSDYRATADAVSAKLAELDADLAAVSDRIAQAEAADNASALPGLRRQESALISQKEAFEGHLNQLLVSADLAQGGGPQIIAEARPAREPFRPTPTRNAVVGAFAGLLIGLALAFVVDHLDDSLRNKDELEAATGLAALALVPRLPNWRNRSEQHIASIEAPEGPAAEAYRSLRTSIQFAGIERRLRILQVTSPRAQDGKTTTIVNLAVAFARAGRRVVLVDCDLRRPRLHSFLGVDNAVGFTSVLVGDVQLEDALQPTVQKGLVVLTAGPIPPAPSELLSTNRAAEILATLAENCDLLLIDSPPVLPVADALLLSDRADAVVLVASAGTTQRREAHRAAELLRQVDAPLIGAVLNQTSAAGGYGGYRYAQYAYKHEEPKRWFGRKDGEAAGDEPSPAGQGATTG